MSNAVKLNYNIGNIEVIKIRIAHIRYEDDIKIIQSVADHCNGTAEYCRTILAPLKLDAFGYYIGILHDAGKMSDKFQKYITDAANGIEVRRGSVNHTFAGVIYTIEKFHNNSIHEKMTSEIAAWVMGSHHGLFDINDMNRFNGFEHRLECDRIAIEYEPTMKYFFEECISETEIEKIFAEAVEEVKAFDAILFENCKKGNFSSEPAGKKTSYDFMLGFLSRVLLSALIEADRRNTAEFMSGKKYPDYTVGYDFWRDELEYFEGRISSFKRDNDINSVRGKISDEAAEFANRTENGGIYRLTVPTGAGKTLTSMRFALNACQKHGLSRIFYVIPLLSVLDQNAKIIKDYSLHKDMVTEHHSNVIRDTMNEDELDRYELVCENWENPVIVTTLVQLLNTFFSGKTQSVRRLHSLAGSVIIIDEVQSIPKKMLFMFNLAVNFLAYFLGCHVVLCSATQPAFQVLDYPLYFQENCDIIKPDKKITEVFKRTEINDLTADGMDMDELADFSVRILENTSSLLVICNTKKTAKELFNNISMRTLEDVKFYFLSASMCMKHRTDTLEKINESLKKREKMICVSTQLVEAGVDFSFESLIRVCAGLDNLSQSAGRCNRSFDYGHICNVYMVRLKNESLLHLEDIAKSQECTMNFAARFSKDRERYKNDMLSDESVAEYYRLLFCNYYKKSDFSYPVQKPVKYDLFAMLSDNSKFISPGNSYIMTQAFAEAGRLFEVFDSSTTDIVVPYDDTASELIADLNSQRAEFDIVYLNEVIRKMKPYTVAVYQYVIDRLVTDGMATAHSGGRIYSLNCGCYDEKTGFDVNHQEIY